MRKLLLTALLIASSCGLERAAASTILFTFDPSMPLSISLNNSIGVGVRVAGLGDFSAPSLGAYDLNVNYDPSALSFTGYTLGDPTLATVANPAGNQLDLEAFGTLSSGSGLSGPGLIRLVEISLDSVTALDTQQPGTFRLATLNFTPLITGSTVLNLTVTAASDALGNSLPVGNTAAPEPQSLLLVGAGAVLLLSRKFARKQA